LLGLFQRMEGCRWCVLHLEAWEETTEMQGAVGKVVICHPSAHLANHLHIVVHPWDDEIRQFYSYTCIAHGQNGVENGLEMPAAYTLVDIIAE